MAILGRFRFSLATILMLVVTAAAASALFSKFNQLIKGTTSDAWDYDLPTLAVLAIGLTALALGGLKDHTAVQTMLQATLAYVGYLSVIWLSEAGLNRLLIYWFQMNFALTVALPMLARRYVKAALPRGPRRSWWKKTCEAVAFSFLNMLLVLAGASIQVLIVQYGTVPQSLAGGRP